MNGKYTECDFEVSKTIAAAIVLSITYSQRLESCDCHVIRHPLMNRHNAL